MKKWIKILGLGISLVACASKGEMKSEDEPMEEKASIHFDFALESYQSGSMIPALASALKAKELAPKSADVANLLGLIYFRQKKLDEAEIEFKRATENNPRLTEAYNNLGTLYLATKKYEKAKVALTKARENPLYLYPERIENNFGLAFEGLKDQAQAENAYLTAIQFNKDFYLPQMNLGRMLFKRGDTKRAEKYLDAALKLCDTCPEPRYYLGRILLKSQRQDAALQLFKKGLELDPEGEMGRLCQQYILQK